MLFLDIFTEKRSNSESHLVKNIKGIPIGIKVKKDGFHQADILKVILENTKEYAIDFRKSITVIGEENKFDPYGEEDWE